MKWDSSFAIGIDVIDDQHRKIFEHLLAIENSVAKRDPWHILHFFLTQLSEYMKFHLAVEEALRAEAGRSNLIIGVRGTRGPRGGAAAWRGAGARG